MIRYISILLFIALHSVMSAQWELKLAHGNNDPAVADTVFKSIAAPSANIIYISGHILGDGFSEYFPSVFKSSDGGDTWEAYTLPYEIGEQSYFSLAFVNEEIGYLVGWKDNQPGIDTPYMRALLVMETLNGGESWEEHFVSTEFDIGNSNPVKAGVLPDGRILITEPGNPGVYISDVDRTTWIPLEVGSNGVQVIKDDILVSGIGSPVRYSTDGFETYTSLQLFQDANIKAGTIDLTQPDTTLYACGIGQSGWFYGYGAQHNYGVIAKHSPSAPSESMLHFLDYYSFVDIEALSDRVLVMSTNTYNDLPFLVSMDQGNTWYAQEFEPAPYFDLQFPKVYAPVNDTLCYAMGANCLYKTTNAGGPPQELIPHIEVDFITSIAEESGITYQLGPNPFTSWITLRSEAFTGAQYTLQLYTLDGRLVQEETLNTEQGLIRWDNLQKLPQGTYLISVHDAGQVLLNATLLKR